MPNERKIQIVKDLKEKLATARGLVLTDYQGLSVPEVEELRKKLSATKSDYQVVKNTLLKLALENVKTQMSNVKLEGPTAVVLSYEDEIPPLKVISDFAKEHESFTIKGGFFAGAWQGAAELIRIAKLPSREELRTRVVEMLQSPIVRFVRVGKGNQTMLVRVLKANVSKHQIQSTKLQINHKSQAPNKNV